MTKSAPAAATQTPWLELAKAAIWPIFIVVLVAIFFAPIRSLPQNSIDRRSAISELKIGVLEIKLSPSSIAQIKPPDDAVAKLAASLDGADIRWLMEQEREGSSSSGCNGQMAPMESDLWGTSGSPTRMNTRWTKENIERAIAFAAATQSRVLKGLLVFENIRGRGFGGDACAPEASGMVTLTPVAWKTKLFLTELLAESLKLNISK